MAHENPVHKVGTRPSKKKKNIGQTWSSGLHPVGKDGTLIFMGFIIMTEI